MGKGIKSRCVHRQTCIGNGNRVRRSISSFSPLSFFSLFNYLSFFLSSSNSITLYYYLSFTNRVQLFQGGKFKRRGKEKGSENMSTMNVNMNSKGKKYGKRDQKMYNFYPSYFLFQCLPSPLQRGKKKKVKDRE